MIELEQYTSCYYTVITLLKTYNLAYKTFQQIVAIRAHKETKSSTKYKYTNTYQTRQ